MDLKEIQTAVAADPTLKTALVGALREDVLTVVKGEGHVFRTKDEDTAFMTNYETTVLPGKIETEVQAKIGTKLKETWDATDTLVSTLTGIKKEPNEKTTAYLERAIKASKGAGDAGLESQLTQLRQQLHEKEGHVPASELTTLQEKYFKQNQSLRISAAQERFPIAVPAHITDDKGKQDYIATQKRFIASDIQTRFPAKEEKDGSVTYSENGKVLMNKDGLPMSEGEIIEKYYAGYFVPPVKVKTGTGSGGSGAGDVNPDEATLKTKQEVNDYLDKKGLTVGDKTRTKEYKRIIADNAITE